jgi:flavin-dependent thymidylate synthase
MNRVEWASNELGPGYYGGDLTHALSAWTSTGRELTDERRARIPKMLKFLASEGHHTPFEKSYLQFLVVADTASHIHLLKHRVGVSVNGESARYKEIKEDKYHIPEDWDEISQLTLKDYVREGMGLYHNAVAHLTETLGRKRAKESARFFYPYANQLILDVSFNFRSFMHFQKLRNSEDAQEEIHKIADDMLSLVKAVPQFRYSLEAFGYGEDIDSTASAD